MFGGQSDRPRGAKQTPSLRAGAERRQRQVMSVRSRAHGEVMKHLREEADNFPGGIQQPGTVMDVWAYNDKTPPAAVPIALLPQLVQMIMRPGSDAEVMQGTLMVRKLLSVDHEPPHDEVAGSGVVPHLVHLLDRFDFPKLQFEAAWALTNVAAGTSKNARLLVECGAIQSFIALLRSEDADCRDQAAWAIGNLAGDGKDIRNAALNAGAIPALLHLLSFLDQPINVLRNTTWAVSNLCRGKPPPPLEFVGAALPQLAGLISHVDVELVADALWAISYISDGPPERVQPILDAGIVPRVVELLSAAAVPVQTAAVRIVGNIAGGEDMQTQTIIDAGALQVIPQLLTHGKREIRKETCWTVSNIAAGSMEQVDALIRANLFPAMIQCCLGGTDIDVRKEAIWAIANVTHCGSTDHLRYLLSCNVIPPLCESLLAQRSKVILVAFEALDGFLHIGAEDYLTGRTARNEVAQAVQECGGLDTLERLQSSDDHEVYEGALKLVELYFTTDDDIPDMPQGNFEFDANIDGGQPTGGQFNF